MGTCLGSLAGRAHRGGAAGQRGLVSTLRQGAAGALVAEATGIRDIASGPLLRLSHDRFIPGVRTLVEAVREASGGATRFFVQLIDFLTVRRRPDPTRYFERYLDLRPQHRGRAATATGDSHWLTASPSAFRKALLSSGEALWEAVLDPRELRDLTYGYWEEITDTHLPHIQELPQRLPALFAAAARRAVEAGFDGVELHFAHAYTMASFLSRTNTRADGYGGSPEGRLRCPLDVVAAVRAEVGPEVCVGVRIVGDEVIEGGSRLPDAQHQAVALARADLDYISISKGGRFEDARQPSIGRAVYPYTGPSGHECMPTVRIDERGPFGRALPLASGVRQALRNAGLQLPVVAAGGFSTFDQMEAALQDGHADIIAAARQSLADPDWFEKIRLGHGASVRRCDYTNYCEGLDQLHREVTCKKWDKVFGPGDEDVPRAADARRRLIAPPWSPPATPRT